VLSRPALFLFVLLASSFGLAQVPAVPPNQDIAVRVEKRGTMIIVDVEAIVATSATKAWTVLTDYDHMASFVSNLKESTVLQRRGDRLHVRQAGEAKKGPLAFSFETVREIELIPEREIRSTLLSGDFKSYQFVTTLAEQEDGSTIIRNHGEYVPNRWVPPVIGPAMIEAETRKQYGDLRAEILRRAQQSRGGF
jgi:hypothetical protein